MFDAAPVQNPQEKCDVEHKKLLEAWDKRNMPHDEHKNLFQRIFDRHKDAAANAEVHADGAVRKLTVPNGWQEMMPKMSRPDAVIGPLQLNEFHAPGNENVRLCYWNRAYGNNREDADTARAFRNVLSAEPHKLSDEELKSLRHLIGDGMYGNPDRFQVIKAETRAVHGKNVLAVEADYESANPELPNRRSYSMYISSDSTGRYTEQLYYVAPQSEYRQHAAAAIDSMHSVRWHRSARAPF